MKKQKNAFNTSWYFMKMTLYKIKFRINSCNSKIISFAKSFSIFIYSNIIRKTWKGINQTKMEGEIEQDLPQTSV